MPFPDSQTSIRRPRMGCPLPPPPTPPPPPYNPGEEEGKKKRPRGLLDPADSRRLNRRWSHPRRSHPPPTCVHENNNVASARMGEQEGTHRENKERRYGVQWQKKQTRKLHLAQSTRKWFGGKSSYHTLPRNAWGQSTHRRRPRKTMECKRKCVQLMAYNLFGRLVKYKHSSWRVDDSSHFKERVHPSLGVLDRCLVRTSAKRVVVSPGIIKPNRKCFPWKPC